MHEMKIHPKMKYTYIGIDSHRKTHTAVLLDCFQDKIAEITFGATPCEFPKFLTEAKKYLLPNTEFAFGMEDISAYGRALAQFLLKNNYSVKHCDASLVSAEREAKSILHKTDAVDAECAARVLINRFNQLPLARLGDKIWVLSNLVARRNSVVKTNKCAKSQLHNFIYDHYPSYDTFFSRIDAVASLAFLEAYPSPQALNGVTVDDLADTLTKATRNQGRAKAQKILDAVHKEGVTSTEEHYQAIRDFTIASLIRQMYSAKDELQLIDEKIKDFLQYFDFDLTEIKGIDSVTMAKFIVEIGDIARFKNAKALAKYAGVAPVIHSSGSGTIHYANSRGNRILNELFFRLAVIQALPRGTDKNLVNPIFHDYYNKKLNEGKTKRQALKAVQRRLVNVIFNMMKHQTTYINPPMVKLKAHTDEASKLVN